MRKVIYSEYVDVGEPGRPPWVRADWKLAEKGEALFHQWGRGTHAEEGDSSFSTAIIELADGTVKNIPAEHVRFISGEVE